MSAALACSPEAPTERSLTERERRLVDAIAHAASRGATLTREQAGTAAGFGRGDVARVQASRALARPTVRAALMQALRESAQIDAANSLAVLRHLERKAGSERVRLDAALAGMRIGGLDTQQHAFTGQGVAIQLVFRTGAGTVLAQSGVQVVEAQADQALAQVDHSLTEEAAQPSARPRGARGGSKAQAAKAAGGVENRASSSASGSTARHPPKKSGGRKVAGSGKAKGGKGRG